MRFELRKVDNAIMMMVKVWGACPALLPGVHERTKASLSHDGVMSTSTNSV